METLKKVYSLPKVLGKFYWGKVTKVAFFPHYNESHLVIHENEFGVAPVSLQPDIRMIPSPFNPLHYEMSDWKRRKWQKLSGNVAYIYVLYYSSDNIPIYIGSSKNPKKRYWQHIRKSYGSVRKNERGKQILPKMAILCECPQEFQFDEERRWILGAKRLFKLKNQVHNR
jgi:predicted GIY-YIG superfamily endonuclease